MLETKGEGKGEGEREGRGGREGRVWRERRERRERRVNCGALFISIDEWGAEFQKCGVKSARRRQKSKRKSGEPHSHLWSRGEQKREGEVRGGRGR